MQTVLDTGFRESSRPLDIVDTQNQRVFEFAIDRLEREVLSYMIRQGSNCGVLNMNHIRGLFYQAKQAVKK